MFMMRALLGWMIVFSVALAGCGQPEVSSPLSQWCTDPPRDGNGNAVLTLVKKPDATLPPQISAQFNDQPEVTFYDDGTNLDQKAGDGIYTRAAKVPVTPTEHSCNPVLEPGSASSKLTGSLSQPVTVSGSCTVKTCNSCLGAKLGLPCVCVSCDVTITF